MSPTSFSALFAKYRSLGVVIDTNLLLVLAIGNYDERRVETFKRTSQYSKNDYLTLKKLVSQFSQIWVTPNILTEVDNLGRQLSEREWQDFSLSVQTLSMSLTEDLALSRDVTSDKRYPRLGLTDTATLTKLSSLLLLTDDLKLISFANNVGIDALNFNHVREFDWS